MSFESAHPPSKNVFALLYLIVITSTYFNFALDEPQNSTTILHRLQKQFQFHNLGSIKFQAIPV